jgi:hypothetical protein
MAAVYATVADIEARWGASLGSQQQQVQAMIDDAHAYIRARVPTVDARVTAGTVDPAVITSVIAQMVLSVLRNPEGLRAEMAGVFQRQLDTSAASGRLTLTDEQLMLLGEGKDALSLEVADDALPAPWRDDPRPHGQDLHGRRGDWW